MLSDGQRDENKICIVLFFLMKMVYCNTFYFKGGNVLSGLYYVPKECPVGTFGGTHAQNDPEKFIITFVQILTAETRE